MSKTQTQTQINPIGKLIAYIVVTALLAVLVLTVGMIFI